MSSRNNEYTIRCISCNIDLIDIYDTKPIKNKRLRVRCPKCKELSFYYKICNEFKFNACNNLCVNNILEEKDVIILEML